ncbi:hypothetical protein BD324DRAFT_647455 [Kockovaella imperatae]|uniref:Uncharacterized protein n=1 Tax=Kockovaella imperatae TaxID=4999 RepID=A0A1Y1UR21_9TREE|nr:hypothetical protein BD324DRAFT_647455 [Kockovaella imperatae]ORX40528.1 hypothetical protein BD324DRAFT_647455 [Kockovaella imperatae]
MSFGGLVDRLSALTGHGIGLGGAEPEPTMESEPIHHVSPGRWSRIIGITAAGAGARVASGSWTWHVQEMMQFRGTLYWIGAVVIILIIAAITNPNEASFRSHLTELSFRRHLAYFRSPDEIVLSEEESTTIDSSGHVTPEIAPVAPFRFASHVSVSLRTPPLHYRTICFFSLALTSPLAPPIFLPDLAPTPLGRKCPWPRERVVLYMGFFGYWVRLGMVPKRLEWVWRLFTDGPKDKGKRKSLLEKPGVMGMRAISSKEETPGTPSARKLGIEPSAGSKRDSMLSMLSPTKNVRKSDSVNNLFESSAPLHPPIQAFAPESRRPSMVNLATPLAQPEADANSPILISLKAELGAAQSALSELEAQLLSHEESVTRAHAHLQTTLDEHRTRRREDDNERQELKGRTKNLDEQKRQAESAKREAEKKLKAVESIRDGLESKIEGAKAEIKRLAGSVEQSKKNVVSIREEGARCVVQTQKAVQRRKQELQKLEGDLEHLDEGNNRLAQAIKEAEGRVAEVLKAGEEAKKLGPEEEMMMMAAAYEAAAQEGYHDSRAHAHQGHRDQWANQAAAYMAEAGMPMLDHNYTARPSQSASFGHLAGNKRGSGEESTENPIGFDNFGPAPRDILRPSTPPQSSDSGSDIWGHDPGSPNGGISSTFSANLLPQGLFRSLEGDQTPLRERMGDMPVLGMGTAQKTPSLGSPPANGHLVSKLGVEKDDSSDSSSEHDLWRSPLPAAGNLREGRLLPPSTTPPGAPALPGLPSLPIARPWLSTSSSENLAFASNDPLVRTTSYEANPNPFAPSASEKKALALGSLNWGPLSRGNRTRNEGGAGTARNLSLNTNWLSSRFPHGSNNNTHPLKTSVSNDAIRSTLSAGQGNQSQGQNDESSENPGDSPKRPFRFFSLRRPTSSGQGSTSSKDGHLSSSIGSNAS